MRKEHCNVLNINQLNYIFSTTQDPAKAQKHISNMLNIPASKVVVKVKRLGGGFGGKETRANLTLLPIAIAARK